MAHQRTFTEELEPESDNFDSVWNELVSSNQGLVDHQFGSSLVDLDEESYQIDQEEAPPALLQQTDDVFPVPSAKISIVPVAVPRTVKAAASDRPEMSAEELFAHRANTVGLLEAVQLQEVEQQTNSDELASNNEEERQETQSDFSPLLTPTPLPIHIHKPIAIRPVPAAAQRPATPPPPTPPKPVILETPADSDDQVQESADVFHTAPATPSKPPQTQTHVPSKFEDPTTGMSPDELFAWRVEKMGILEALRLLELEQVEQDRILALEEKEEEAASMMTATAAEFESAFNSSSSMGIIPSTTHVLLNKKDAGDAAPIASAFSEDDHNKVMMDYVFGKDNPLVTRGQSFNVSPPAVQVNTATPATEVKSTNEDPSGLDNNNGVQTDEVQEDNDLDDMLFVKDIPAVDTRKFAFVETKDIPVLDVDSDDELEESPKAGIWTLGTLTLAVGVVAVVGYLAFGRGKRRGGARK